MVDVHLPAMVAVVAVGAVGGHRVAAAMLGGVVVWDREGVLVGMQDGGGVATIDACGNGYGGGGGEGLEGVWWGKRVGVRMWCVPSKHTQSSLVSLFSHSSPLCIHHQYVSFCPLFTPTQPTHPTHNTTHIPHTHIPPPTPTGHTSGARSKAG